jgi:hypothetical protein
MVLGLCKVGMVGWSAGGECVEGSGSVVTGWRTVGGEGERRGRKWMRWGRKSRWEGDQWIVALEKEGE